MGSQPGSCEKCKQPHIAAFPLDKNQTLSINRKGCMHPRSKLQAAGLTGIYRIPSRPYSSVKSNFDELNENCPEGLELTGVYLTALAFAEHTTGQRR